MDGVSVGIDLGNEIKVAWFNPIKGNVSQIKNSEGQLITPAVVSFEEEIRIGESAVHSFTELAKQQYVFFWQSHHISQPGYLATPTGRYRYIDILQSILEKVRRDIEFYFFNTALIHVTLAYPSFYDSLQRHILMEVIKNAGFGSVSLLPAAVAVAVACEKKGIQVANTILICDVGAQSSKLTVLNRGKNDTPFEISGETDNFSFGGNQIDWLLYQYVEKRFLSDDEANDSNLDGELLQECKIAKEIWSLTEDSKQTHTLLRQRINSSRHAIFDSIEQIEFRKLIQESVETIVSKIGQLIAYVKEKSANNITQVIVTGGSSNLIGFKQILQKNLQGKLDIVYIDEPLIATVVGCVYQNENLRPAKKRDVLILTKNETRARFTDHLQGSKFVLVDGTKTSTGIWDVFRKQLKYVLDTPYFAGSIGAIAINKQENLIVTGSADNMVRMWHVETGSLLRTFYGHNAAISFVFIDQTHQRIISNSYDETLKVWDMLNGEMLLSIPYCEGIGLVAIDSKGKCLAGLNLHTNKLRIWDMATGNLIRRTESVSFLNEYYGLEFNYTGDEIYILGKNGKLKI